MTDEAMNVAAEPAAAPEAAPVEVSAPEIDHSSEVTPRDAIDRAFAEVDNIADDTPVVQPEAQEGQPRTPDGKFAAKEKAAEDAQVEAPETPEGEKPQDLSNFGEAPNRFSADAKEAWKDAPEAVRAEITRAVTELESGINQYREKLAPFEEFSKRVESQGAVPAETLKFFTNMEDMMYQNPIQGLDTVISNMQAQGLLKVGSLNELVSVMSNQTPDQRTTQQDQTIRQLHQEINSLKEQISGVSSTVKSQSEQAMMQQINEFAADKPRFEELANDIAFFLDNGRAKDLPEAYSLAERLNPAPQAPAPATPAAQAATPAEPAQPRKGDLSPTGAPSSGSTPANRKPPSTVGDSIDSAFASVGL